jgi:hypothetical protein
MSDTSITYENGKWGTIGHYDGQEKPMRGGFEEAKESASIFFTG